MSDSCALVDQLLLSLMEKRKTLAPGQHLVEDLGFDSLKMMEMMIALEERLDVVIPVTEAAQITTVADLYRAVERERLRSTQSV